MAPYTSGAAAMAALSLSQERFDGVITDLEMPETDGHAVVQMTRRHLPLACLVVCSARATENRARLVEAGVCLVAEKPIEGIVSMLAECRRCGGPGIQRRCPKHA